MRLTWHEKIKSGEELNIDDIQNLIKTLKKILAKGGVVVVSEGNTLITTYELNSYSRKKAMNSSR